MKIDYDNVWPFTYNDHGLLIGPLRMRRASTGYNDVWVYCWDDPGVRERVRAQVDAIVDFEQYHKRHIKD